MIADGPRRDHPDDADKCAASRAVIERVDWECNVFKDYSDVNLGCGRRPATGISWVFEHVEEAIILEDDCVPDPSFFRFCEGLLARYRRDERVMMISGDNFLPGSACQPYSYYFCRSTGLWGWATWRRAWRYFDMGIESWSSLRDSSWVLDIQADPSAASYWHEIFDRIHDSGDAVDIWDYQWTFAVWSQRGFAISPSVNLVYNIGFGKDATHTKSATGRNTSIPSSKISFPLRHPPHVALDPDVDRLIFERVYAPRRSPEPPDLRRRVRRKLSPLVPAAIRKAISYVRSKWT